ncbi:MAG TPA: 4Fe-4S binding protein, partial [Thermoplasmata archaeon]|nr:4Fe-4S binding protein [Thermoplasmata archaeon]
MAETGNKPAEPLRAERPPQENPLLWVARPMLTAARQFGKSLVHPSTIVYPYERLEDPQFRDRVAVASGKPIGVGQVWDNYRGVHALNVATCISCNLCAFSCPDLCIDMVTVPGGDPKHPKKCPEIDYGKCSYCGFCSDACPEGCLTMTTRYENSVSKGSYMIYTPQKMYVIFQPKLPMN